MKDAHELDCLIHENLLSSPWIKGEEVDLKLMAFEEQKENTLPYYLFHIMKDDQVVGTITLRLGFIESTWLQGHIGYEIKPLFQGNRYGFFALEMIKDLARDHGYRYVLITCEPHNEQSKKIILRSRGKLIIQGNPIPKDHIYHVLGIMQLDVYMIDLYQTV